MSGRDARYNLRSDDAEAHPVGAALVAAAVLVAAVAALGVVAVLARRRAASR